MVGKDDADGEQLGEQLEQHGVAQHALLEALVEEAVVLREELVERARGAELLQEHVPVGLEHLVRVRVRVRVSLTLTLTLLASP